MRNESQTINQVISDSKRYVNELIVVDGHSTDDSFQKAKKTGVRVFKDNGKGKGIEKCNTH